MKHDEIQSSMDSVSMEVDRNYHEFVYDIQFHLRDVLLITGALKYYVKDVKDEISAPVMKKSN
jgi:hypothetical protein